MLGCSQVGKSLKFGKSRIVRYCTNLPLFIRVSIQQKDEATLPNKGRENRYWARVHAIIRGCVEIA